MYNGTILIRRENMSNKRKFIIELTDDEVEVLYTAMCEAVDHAVPDEDYSPISDQFNESTYYGARDAVDNMQELK
jgi:hypothetical protein